VTAEKPFADLHFWVISAMAALVAVSDRSDIAASVGRVGDYAARHFFGHRVAECTDVELHALADCLDEFASASDYLGDVLEQACLVATQLRHTPHDLTSETSSPEGVSA